jgi:predicted RNase H-like nuclease
VAIVAGVDGCRGRWLTVAQDTTSNRIAASIHETPQEVLTAFPKANVIAVDVPIGLPERGQRDCDHAARQLLGPRRSSVFPAPIRPTLLAETREDANRIGKETDGRGVGCQSWGIYPYVRAWDDAIRGSESARGQIREVHPEICFWAINQYTPLLTVKRIPEGLTERHDLLVTQFGKRSIAEALEDLGNNRFAMDDFFDALAALWIARRVAARQAVPIPADLPIDRFGLPMVIWY